MSYAFNEASSFNHPLPWDTSMVASFAYTFASASSFDQDLSSWDVSNVTTMEFFLAAATNFNSPVTGWNLAAATSLSRMFLQATSFDQDLDSWSVSANLETLQSAFEKASSFNGKIGSNWDVSEVTSMEKCFRDARNFNQLLDQWSTGSVTSFAQMFSGASSFQQPLTSWDLSAATNLNNMFEDASAFWQDLCPWGVRLSSPFRSVSVVRMFDGTQCPLAVSPGITSSSAAPLCFSCT